MPCRSTGPAHGVHYVRCVHCSRSHSTTVGHCVWCPAAVERLFQASASDHPGVIRIWGPPHFQPDWPWTLFCFCIFSDERSCANGGNFLGLLSVFFFLYSFVAITTSLRLSSLLWDGSAWWGQPVLLPQVVFSTPTPHHLLLSFFFPGWTHHRQRIGESLSLPVSPCLFVTFASQSGFLFQ